MLFQIKGKILDRDRIGKLFLVDFGYTKIIKKSLVILTSTISIGIKY